MFLTSCVLESKVHEISVLPTAFSDHSCVLLKLLASSTCTRGRGYWKLNKSLLSEACYRRKITAFGYTGNIRNHSFCRSLNGGTPERLISNLCQYDMEFNAKENEIKLGPDLNNHYKKHSLQFKTAKSQQSQEQNSFRNVYKNTSKNIFKVNRFVAEHNG